MHCYGVGYALHHFATNYRKPIKMHSESNVPMSTDAPAGPLQDIQLLVVDDSKINLLIAEKLLTHAGASVHLAEDGSAALAWLKQNREEIDLVFLDIQMPVMDGLTAVGLIRSELGLHHLPVIAMTGADSNEEMARALACGMTDHLIKPFNYKSLVSVVLQYVSKNATPPYACVPDAGIADEGDWPAIAGIDIPKARHGYMGDQQSFFKQLRRLLIEFECFQTPRPSPADAQGWRELAMQMHKMVGSAGLLAAPALTLAARRVEWLAKVGEAQGLSVALQEVATQLLLLKQSTSDMVVKQTDPMHRSPIPSKLDKTAVLDWVQELENQNFSAVKRFAVLSGALAAALGTDRMSELSIAMDNLDFECALEIVRPLTDIE